MSPQLIKYFVGFFSSLSKSSNPESSATGSITGSSSQTVHRRKMTSFSKDLEKTSVCVETDEDI